VHASPPFRLEPRKDGAPGVLSIPGAQKRGTWGTRSSDWCKLEFRVWVAGLDFDGWGGGILPLGILCEELRPGKGFFPGRINGGPGAGKFDQELCAGDVSLDGFVNQHFGYPGGLRSYRDVDGAAEAESGGTGIRLGDLCRGLSACPFAARFLFRFVIALGRLLLRSRLGGRLQIDAGLLFRMQCRFFCGHRSPVSGHALRTIGFAEEEHATARLPDAP